MTIRIDGTNTVANPGITGSDTDTGLQFGTNEVKVVTGGSTRTTVDSSGNLLIATSTARSTAGFGTPRLQLKGDYQSSILLTEAGNTTNSVGLVLSKIRGTSIVQNGDPLGYIQFTGYDGSNDRAGAYIQANVDGTPGASDMPTRLAFSTTADGAASPTERLRITSNGTLQLRNSPGIDFSQLQTETSVTGASMTSEVLDSYEVGTWTPYYSSSGATTANVSDIVNSYATQNGRYTKIGRQVFVEAYIALASSGVAYQNGGATNQNLSIAGLPFTGSSSSTYPSISVGYFASWPSWSTGYTPMGYLETGNTFIRLTHATSGGFTYILTNNVIANNSGLLFSLTYTVP